MKPDTDTCSPQPRSGMGERIIRAKVTSESDSWVEIRGQKKKKIIIMTK